jgi:hypothetical protein
VREVVERMFDEKVIEIELLLPSALNVAGKRRSSSTRKVSKVSIVSQRRHVAS